MICLFAGVFFWNSLLRWRPAHTVNDLDFLCYHGRLELQVLITGAGELVCLADDLLPPPADRIPESSPWLAAIGHHICEFIRPMLETGCGFVRSATSLCRAELVALNSVKASSSSLATGCMDDSTCLAMSSVCSASYNFSINVASSAAFISDVAVLLKVGPDFKDIEWSQYRVMSF